jgi:hypothetical protein
MSPQRGPATEGQKIGAGFRVAWGNGVVWGDASTDKFTAMSQGGIAITGEN